MCPPDGDAHAEIQRFHAEKWAQPEFLEFLRQGAEGETQDDSCPAELFQWLLAAVQTPTYKASHDALSKILNSISRREVPPGQVDNLSLLVRLLLPPDGSLHEEIRRMDAQGWLTPEFRRYLERGAVGEFENAPCTPTDFSYILGEILDVRFIPPDVPEKLRELYVYEIDKALATASLSAVESLIEGISAEGLFNREFVEFFGDALKRHRAELGQLTADEMWKLVIVRLERGDAAG